MCLKHFDVICILIIKNGHGARCEKEVSRGNSETMCYNNDIARFCLKTKNYLVCFDTTTNRINMDDSDHRNRGEKVGNMLLLADGGKLKVSAAS
jgi:hypothetical protein